MGVLRDKLLVVAEMMDAFRVIPRLLVAGYCGVLYKTVTWYMALKPYFPEEVKHIVENSEVVSSEVMTLMVQAPTTQHAALVTAVIGISAAIFGLYTSSGRSWKKQD